MLAADDSGELSPSTVEVNLGFVAPGGQAHHVLTLWNPRRRVVDVAEVRTSCDCLRINLARRAVGPSERVAALVQLDLALEPEFCGGLDMTVDGFDRAGARVFHLPVIVCVDPVATEVESFGSRAAHGH